MKMKMNQMKGHMTPKLLSNLGLLIFMIGLFTYTAILLYRNWDE